VQGAIMEKNQQKQSNRYINDLRRMDYLHGQVKNVRSRLLPFVIAAIFLIIAWHLWQPKPGRCQ
jgi:hypothetical protein